MFSSNDSKNDGAQEMSRCTHVAGAGSRGQTTVAKYLSTRALSLDSDHTEFTLLLV